MHRRFLRTTESFLSAVHRLPATPGFVHCWKSFSFSHKSVLLEPRAALFSSCQAEMDLFYDALCIKYEESGRAIGFVALVSLKNIEASTPHLFILLLSFFFSRDGSDKGQTEMLIFFGNTGLRSARKEAELSLVQQLFSRWRSALNKEETAHLIRSKSNFLIWHLNVPEDPRLGWKIIRC